MISSIFANQHTCLGRPSHRNSGTLRHKSCNRLHISPQHTRPSRNHSFTMAPTNTAAYYSSDKAPSLEIANSPYPTPGPDEIIIKVAAAAINPVDSKIQSAGTALFPFLTYPMAAGIDVSGTVVEVGSSATSKFHVGDRVLGFLCEFTSRSGGFQSYVAASTSVVTKLPKETSLIEAATLPSGVATAAEALYACLGLDHPSVPPRPRNGKTVLVGGGASVIGSSAIQFAVASGYEVITTSSPANFEHCLSLGAALVFDYRAPDLANKLVSAFSERECAGALSCVAESNPVVFEVVSKSKGNKVVACSLLFSKDGVPAGVKADMFHAYNVKDTPLAEVVFGAFLPAALESGQYKCAPKARVVGHGLESVQKGFDILARGVSCEKLVVTLGEQE
ncbi:GroES-like protein [Xylaria bambusicola]|uniref:GroES-like protein n=1 Tax=Xylaria bambusicola TaxID=326684 RepID=UPI0020076799|nr:GroES-like protein [Xylaria bambusicola]KAI0513286.1 GroES-like protein [Xylaria bambusicola]